MPPRVVVTYAPAWRASGHEQMSLCTCARALAELQQIEFDGEFERQRHHGRPLYVVPAETLAPVEAAHALGVSSEADLFGGVVPFDFVGTKVITHPLVELRAFAPVGWSSAFAERVRNVVLPGYCAFTARDAKRGAERLLREGPVRIKHPHGVGGAGQVVVRSIDELWQHVQAIEPAILKRCGIVLEGNLDDVRTLSVGQVQVADLLVGYIGRQRLTADHRGRQVYGGSALTLVRGGYDALISLPTTDQESIAIEQARTYHAAAMLSYPQIIASRSNYDVAQGIDAQGRWCSGVLEQSWRIGGASGAEIVALRAFRDDPERRVVRAATVELYREAAPLPAEALVCFNDVDSRVGALTKYACLEDDVDP